MSLLNREFIIIFIFIELFCIIKGDHDCCNEIKSNMFKELIFLKKGN